MGAVADGDIADCEPLQADATRWLVRWRDARAVPTDRPVRVVCELADTCLFSLSGR